MTGITRLRVSQDAFSRIAPRYEWMNQFMTFGQVNRLRREVVRRVQLQPGESLLDLGAGPGFLAKQAIDLEPSSRVIAADLNLPMLRVGVDQFRGLWSWSAADALHLPFSDESFDAVISGFLLRNVVDLSVALQEIYRVTKPGGRIAMLDTTHPPKNFLRPAIDIQLHYVIPFVGGVVTGQGKAYQYLIHSTESFLKAEELAEKMQECGFNQVGFSRRLMGMLAIHWGVK